MELLINKFGQYVAKETVQNDFNATKEKYKEQSKGSNQVIQYDSGIAGYTWTLTHV